MNFVDTDLLIQEKAGKALQNIIDEDGRDAFEAIEREVLMSMDTVNTVIATGGSAVYYDDAMEHLSSMGQVVYLQVSIDEIKKRLNNIKTRGIAMAKGQNISDLYLERKTLYEKWAEISIPSSEISLEETVDVMVRKLKRR
jgi:shikimate kinase